MAWQLHSCRGGLSSCGSRLLIPWGAVQLAEDLDTKSLFADYLRLTEEDVKACLAYAEAVVEGEDVFATP